MSKKEGHVKNKLSVLLRRYGVAVLSVALAGLLTLLLPPVAEGAPFAFFFAAVMVSAWYGGLGPGLLAIALSVILSAYFLFPPFYSLHVGAAGDLLRLSLFILVASLISSLQARQQRAEEAERVQRQYFQVTLASIGDAVMVTDPTGTVTFMNGVAQTVTGWTQEDALGKSLSDIFVIFNEETRQPVENPVSKVLREGNVVGLANHTVLRTKGRKEVPIDDSAAPIRDGAGQLRGIILVFRDISERRRAEAALQESHNLLQAIIEGTPDAVFVKDRQRRYLMINSAGAGWLGKSVEEVIGQTDQDVFAHESVPGIVEHDQHVLTTGEPQAYEHVGTAAGVTRTYHSVKVPYRDQHGAILGVIGIARDITERKQVEERLAHQAAELQRSNEAMQQFSYVVSHDLQEPLRTVVSFLQLLAKRCQGKLDAEADEFIGYAVDGAQRMQVLLRDLLEYTRVGRDVQPFTTVDCTARLQQTLHDLQLTIKEQGASVTYDPLPSVQGDAKLLGLIFQNLIGNALKFRSQAPPQIHLSARRERAHWLFSIQDNGIGIDPQYAERIFEVFQRLHTRKEYAGTGIGLAICKKIVERHGGRLWVKSEPGKGATFFFTVPA